jgi:riboflavin kinase/FMN adenylyltransferase
VRIVRGSGSLEKPLERCVLTVGNFDGLHVGHRRILATVIGRARALEGEAAVYTFDPHPRKVLAPERAPRLLTTLEQKLELLAAAGVDVTIVEPFDLDFARVPAERFVREVLFERIAPLEVYVGYDFRYGRDREGSMRTLTELGPHLGFAVTIVPEVKLGSRDVNSTRIRELLEQGQVVEAALLLGRRYTIRGSVVEGARRGRTLGFPTLNLAAENEVLPQVGVYACTLRFLDAGMPPAGSVHLAVTNVGRRPTFGDLDQPITEAHLLDFSADAYGRRVELAFVEQLRAEQRFASVEALRAQIARDVERARARLSGEREAT